MDSAWAVMMPVLWLMAALLYGVIFMAICFIVPPHPRATGRSLLLDFSGCLLAALPTLLILGMIARLAWNFTVSQPFLIGLGGPALMGLIFGLAFAYGRRAAGKNTR